MGLEPITEAGDQAEKKVGEDKEAKPKTCIEKIKLQQLLIKDSLQDIKKNLKTKVTS